MIVITDEAFVRTGTQVLGIMDKGNLSINKRLGPWERQNTLQKLLDAREQGYDSCTVTTSGTYGTKSLPI
jgi:hypothetical protein